MVDEETGNGDVFATEIGGQGTTPPDVTLLTLDSLQPTPAEALTLWQLFVDRVDPLTKVIHVPSMQTVVARTDLSLPHRGLVFAIYGMAVVSLSEEECVATFAQDRNALMQRFNAGTKTALLAYDYIRNYSMITVQTLHLYLVRSPLHSISLTEVLV